MRQTKPNPVDHLYLYRSATDHIVAEKQTEHEVERALVEEGIGSRVYLKGEPYPLAGFPTPEALAAVNLVKRLILNYATLLTRPLFLPSTLLCLLSKRRIERALFGFKRTVRNTIAPFILKPQYRQPITNEVELLLEEFLNRQLGFRETYWIPTIIAHVFEYDMAYRIRLQDICSETTPQKLADATYSEVRRLLRLLIQRDNIGTAGKFRTLLPLITLALLIPRIRRAFSIAVLSSNFELFQYDQAAIYWALKRTDYNSFGKSFEERKKLVEVVKMGQPWRKYVP